VKIQALHWSQACSPYGLNQINTDKLVDSMPVMVFYIRYAKSSFSRKRHCQPGKDAGTMTDDAAI